MACKLKVENAEVIKIDPSISDHWHCTEQWMQWQVYTQTTKDEVDFLKLLFSRAKVEIF